MVTLGGIAVITRLVQFAFERFDALVQRLQFKPPSEHGFLILRQAIHQLSRIHLEHANLKQDRLREPPGQPANNPLKANDPGAEARGHAFSTFPARVGRARNVAPRARVPQGDTMAREQTL